MHAHGLSESSDFNRYSRVWMGLGAREIKEHTICVVVEVSVHVTYEDEDNGLPIQRNSWSTMSVICSKCSRLLNIRIVQKPSSGVVTRLTNERSKRNGRRREEVISENMR